MFQKDFPTYQPKYLWGFIFKVAEKEFSLKGSIKPYIKRFSNLSTKLFMGFYF
jgi:hypothetical protein